jgi:hypothetical protein
MVDIQESVLFWHLTSFDNMKSILKDGLLSRDKLLGSEFINDASPELIEERKEKELDKYVPFHFVLWNAYDKKILADKKNKDKQFCYITIHQDLALDSRRYKISIGYPNHKEIELRNYDDCKNEIDKKRRNTDIAYGKSSRKDKEESLGECLALDCVSSEYFKYIFVKTEVDKKELERIKNNLDKRINCDIIVKENYFRDVRKYK